MVVGIKVFLAKKEMDDDYVQIFMWQGGVTSLPLVQGELVTVPKGFLNVGSWVVKRAVTRALDPVRYFLERHAGNILVGFYAFQL